MTPARLAALATLYALVVLAILIARPRSLGHDEAVYAVGARGLIEGHPADEFPLHRSIGMRVLAAPGLALGGGERAMRLPFVAIALAYLAAVHAIARARFGARAAALALALIATTSLWQWRAGEALSDIPAALALLGLVGLAAGPPTAWRALAAAACAALAVYLRYASAPVVAAIFVAALIGAPARWRWLAGAALGALALLAPFLVWSHDRTGSIVGVLTTGERFAARRYPFEGLVYYLRAWPIVLAGPVTGVAAALGAVAGIAAWRRGWRAADDEARARRLLATAGLAQIVLLGWRVHGEARFVIFAMTALAMVAAAWLAEDPRRWRAGLLAVALTALPSAVWTITRVDRLAASRVGFRHAAAAIRADAAGADCQVFSTEVPMTIWYTGCATVQVDGWGLDPARARGERSYLLEARGLPRSIGDAGARTQARLGWQPIACAAPDWCVWRATPAAR